jgi:hypothetical protein
VIGCGSTQKIAYYENVGTPEAAEFVWALELTFGTGTWSAPEHADLDGDGDLDLFVGRGRVVHYFRNEAPSPGPPSFVEVTGDADFGPAASTIQSHLDAEVTPRFFDEDADGDLDLLAGSFAFDLRATVAFFRNDGTAAEHDFVFVTDDYPALGEFEVSVNGVPADLDEDGDADLVFGSDDGRLAFARNVGSPGAPEYVLETHELDGLDVGKDAVPYFADIDDDGDLDLFIGERGGGLNFFRNVTVPRAQPTAFALSEPPADALVGRNDVRFDWEPAYDPDTGTEVLYEFRLASSPDAPPDAWVVHGGLMDSEIVVNVADALGSMRRGSSSRERGANAFWTVMARNGCAEMAAPEWRGLSADLQPPASDGTAFAIRAAFPSPSRRGTTVAYSLPASGRVRVTVHDLLGRRVRTLFDGLRDAGTHQVEWDGTSGRATRAASGVYVVRVAFDGRIASRRVVLVR